MKNISFLQTLLFLFLFSSFSFAQLYYVSNQGSDNGDGSLDNPFNKISMAYAVAVLNGQNEVIKLMPGNYYEADTLVFDNENISIFGSGDGSVIQNDIIVKSDMSFANCYIQGLFSNEAFVVFNNVKCNTNNINTTAISGMWRGDDNKTHINSLIDPLDGMEAVNLDSMNNHVSNYVAEAGLATEDYVNTKQMTTINIADNAVNLDKLNTTSVDNRYLKKTGDTAGTLTVTNLNVYHGRLGVGTKTPQVLFHVKEEHSESGILHFEGADGGLFRIDTFSGNVNLDNIKYGGILYMGRDMFGNGYICLGKSTSGIANTLVIPTGSNPYAGKIGIGTSTPQAKLDVNGKIKSNLTTSGDSDDTVTTKGYVDNKELTSANISAGSITKTKIAAGAVTIDKLAQEVDNKYVNANGDTMTGTLKMSGLKRQVFKFNSQNRHAIGIKDSGSGNVFSLFANNIFHFNTITENAETTQNGSCQLEITPNWSKFHHTLYVAGDVNISDTLSVPQINITGSADWNIGSANQRADIVIKNPNSEIKSDNGDVILNAAANKIVMKSKVKFSADQFGSATIAVNSSTITVTDKNVSSAAVILLTPRDEVPGAPYAQINADGTFDIKLPDTVIVPTVINYLILE